MTDNKTKAIKITSDDEVYNFLTMPFGASEVMKKAKAEINKRIANKEAQVEDMAITHAIALREFDNGILLAEASSELVRVFVAQFAKDLMQQYKCDTVAKKSLAEITALNFGRIISIQKYLLGFARKDEYSDLTSKIVGVLSKELDRAQRHYLTSLQALEMGVQPPLRLNIHTQSTNIANQQAIQQVGEQTNVNG